MKDRTKYMLIGIIIGIIIGIGIFYLFTTFRIFRPFGFGDFSRNFSRPLNRSTIP